MPVTLLQATAVRPGAIAIIQLIGDHADLMRELTGVADWPLQHMRLVNFADIDEGLAVRLSDRVAHLMPHGGPRVVQRLTMKLVELGAVIADASQLEAIDPQLLYPEAVDRFDALMLATLARAQSPLAIDLLLDQPRRWRSHGKMPIDADCFERSTRLNRLIDPPIVVVAGRPNVGKSSLSNALIGRSMSLAYDLPGTTRDYIAGRIDLAGLVVNWHDTPGIRETNDPIERKAIELSKRLIARADLLIAMTDLTGAWPELPREPDLCVMNKCDLATGESNDFDESIHRISVLTGENLATLVRAIRDRLVSPNDLADAAPWLFDSRLNTNVL